MLTLQDDDPTVVAASQAIHRDDLVALQRLLDAHPGLASARIANTQGSTRTLLHTVADWPGHFPNGAAMVGVLTAAGAAPNTPVTGSWHRETPLHWAASSNDVAVLDALLDAGADIEATGASIGGGTPLNDAVGYGQWRVARRLVERGARVERLWQAAALGLLSQVQQFLTGAPLSGKDVGNAFWQACHGGQQETAAYLLARGADINWIPDWSSERTPQTPLDIAAPDHEHTANGRPDTTDLLRWLRDHGARPAADLQPPTGPG